jgi:hypothetical protein
MLTVFLSSCPFALSVIFLVVFAVLGMMTIWAYIKVRSWLYDQALPSPPSLRQCSYAYM